MTKFSFEVGDSEKHIVNVNWSKLMKWVRIEVDGKVVVDKPNLSPVAKRYEFDVGESEIHKVEVGKSISAGLEVFVDGKQVK